MRVTPRELIAHDGRYFSAIEGTTEQVMTKLAAEGLAENGPAFLHCVLTLVGAGYAREVTLVIPESMETSH